MRQFAPVTPMCRRSSQVRGLARVSAAAERHGRSSSTTWYQQARGQISWHAADPLIHGARSVLTHSKSPTEWLTELVKRRPKNVAVVAMANKMARTIWALMAHERAYQSGYVSRPA
jgi:hypothetical protein